MDILANLLQPFLEIVLAIFLPVVLGFLAVLIRSWIAKAKAEIEARNLDWLLVLAGQFVAAAEQAGITGELENLGEAKKQMVVDMLQAAADQRGIRIDADALSALIEAAVVDAFGFSKDDEVVPE
jgi:hypothetical protein